MIKKPTAFMKAILPMLVLSLQAVKLVNMTSGIARCLGYPVPYINRDALSKSGRSTESEAGGGVTDACLRCVCCLQTRRRMR